MKPHMNNEVNMGFNVQWLFNMNLYSNEQQIYRCQQYNYLGVLLDECMTLRPNFNCIYKKFSHKIYQFGKIRKYIDVPTRVLVYKQTILPLVDYVSFMLMLKNYRNCKIDVLDCVLM